MPTDTHAELEHLRRTLREHGYFDKPRYRHLWPWGAHVLACLGATLLAHRASGAGQLAALAIAVFTLLCIATIGHTASHGGLSSHGPVNQLVLYSSYPFLLGLSARYWVRSHVITHHPSPNRVGVDRDCDLRPFFALNEEHLGTGRWRRRYRRIQGVVLPLLLPLNGFGIQLQGWRALIAELAGGGPRPRAIADLACLLLHLAVFVVLPCALFGPALALALDAIRIALVGTLLFAILAPGHYPADAACLGPEWDREDFAVRQVLTTINFRTGLLGRFVCNGLEYQIEHHLFPTIAHAHLPEVSVLVRDFCARVGLPYRSLGWGRAIWESYRVFFVPKVVRRAIVRPPVTPPINLPVDLPEPISRTVTTSSSPPPESRVA